MSKGLSIACIDPGEETGLWWGVFGIKELRKGPWYAMRSAFDDGRMMFEQIDSNLIGELEAAVQIDCWLELCEGETKRRTQGKLQELDAVVIEDFILRSSTMGRELLSPVRLTRGVEQEMYRRHITDKIVFQQPSAMKSVVKVERCNRKGFAWTYARRHEWDAFRHGHLFLRNYCNKNRSLLS